MLAQSSATNIRWKIVFLHVGEGQFFFLQNIYIYYIYARVNTIFRSQKFFWKKLKKGVDKPFSLCYNVQVAAKKRGRQTVFENWTTRDSIKHSKCEISRQFWKRNTTLKKVKRANQARNWFYPSSPRVKILWFREFDPGSGLTLAACITHSSRTDGRELAPWS